jgi:DnaJ-class molecular chaperone
LKNHYETLGVAEDATQADIKKAYRKLATKYHPDKNDGSPDAESKFKEVAEAYETIGNDPKRKAYDNSRKFRGTPNADFFGNFGSFRDFSFGGGRPQDYRHLTVVVDKWTTVKDLMDGTTFDIQYVVTKTESGSTTSDNKQVKIKIDLANESYPIAIENGKYSITLKVRGGGSSQQVEESDFFGKKRNGLISGDLVVRINIDMMGLSLDQSDLIQNFELSLHDILFTEEVILESPMGKKYRIKAVNRDTLSDIVVKIPNQGLRSAFGNKGNYIFKILVKKPNFSNISEENLQILKDLLIDVNK